MAETPVLLTAPTVVDADQDRTMILNMGPQHPSTHGVLRLVLEIDGEVVVRVAPDIAICIPALRRPARPSFISRLFR